MAADLEPTIHVNILVERQGELYVAHCLEIDIVATGETPAAASRDLLDLVRAQLEYALANDNMDNFFRPAPPEVWAKLKRVRRKVENCTSERISGPLTKKPLAITRLEADQFCYV